MLSPIQSSQRVSVPPLVQVMVALYVVMLSTVMPVGAGQVTVWACIASGTRHPTRANIILKILLIAGDCLIV